MPLLAVEGIEVMFRMVTAEGIRAVVSFCKTGKVRRGRARYDIEHEFTGAH